MIVASMFSMNMTLLIKLIGEFVKLVVTLNFVKNYLQDSVDKLYSEAKGRKV